MRLAVILFAALVTVPLVACGGDTEVASDNQPPADAQDVAQDQAPLLAEGEFIDSKPIGGDGGAWISIPGGLPGVVSRADAVVVAEITDVVDIIGRTQPAPPNFPVAQVEDYPLTIYSARVEQWIKGSGADEILIAQFGGVSASGPRFTDGDFLLQRGRRYVVALMDKDKLEGIPGTVDYVKRGLGFGAFEVTDGYVHVLNNPLTQELQGEFGGMPLREFVGILRDFVANPPPSPTPLPSPTTRSVGPVPSISPFVHTIAIDTDVNRTPVNTATSLGALEACNTIRTGGALIIDITVGAASLAGEPEDGIAGFQFTLLYDPSKVRVVASDPNMLLAANAGSNLVLFGDDTPDFDGSFVMSAVDFGDAATAERGSGVLARITLEGVSPGVSPLSLADVLVADSFKGYTVNNVLNAQVAVDVACPTTN